MTKLKSMVNGEGDIINNNNQNNNNNQYQSFIVNNNLSRPKTQKSYIRNVQSRSIIKNINNI